ncbi:hypothetical protein QBC37DRAFT_390754 [Rhypophila decipiens]|uniref:Zn(2)-C6 fungal-type domain-containing protein n=1 Tax=Rhypophila decipiens TaxID=261697 RepID=A0AAN6Y0P7_9PEZI|nr:hypothetical protein QBC37DRAFT_390754 [Rhypophila decipiens]
MSSPYPPPPQPSPGQGNTNNNNNTAIKPASPTAHVPNNNNEQQANTEQTHQHQQLEHHFQHHQEHHDAHQQQQQSQLFDPGLDAHDLPETPTHVDAVTAAHHGLAALQAAVAAPNPVHQQFTAQQDALYDISLNGVPNGAVPISQPATKATRLRRACDMCSQRKVKCDEKHPCRPCRDLNVECTFNRETKRRGPPNKHAEAAKAAKRQRLQPNISPGPHHAAETLISIAGTPGHAAIQGHHTVLDAEAIAPISILELLVDDFFTYIHPLTPFPHEPSFRRSFLNREDRTNREFLALLASMIGSLVASFPRTARVHLKTQGHGMLYPRAIDLVEKCRAVALEARGSQFYTKEEVTVYDAATSYFLGLAAAYTMQWKICKRYMAETMAFIREMGYHKPRDLGNMHTVTYRGPSFDLVQDQLGKRIFWTMFLGIRSMLQLGSPQAEMVLPPPTPSEPYPEFPVEVDDQFILPQQILGQPQGVVSKLTGFNQAIKIYMTMNPVVSIELSYGITTLPFHDQRAMLSGCLQAAKDIMHGLPQELTLNLTSFPNASEPTFDLGDLGSGVAKTDGFMDDGFQYYTAAYAHHQPSNAFKNDMEQRRLQYEIQKANIYTSQLATRSYYVERYLNLRDNHRQAVALGQASDVDGNGLSDPIKNAAVAALSAVGEQADPVDATMLAERELIVQNLLTVLASISQRNMEPNGHSLVNKIRQVASTLVNSSPERKGPLAVKAEETLNRFLDIMLRLEKSGTGEITVTDSTMNTQEEEELRAWADLHDHQVRFFQNGGFLNQV